MTTNFVGKPCFLRSAAAASNRARASDGAHVAPGPNATSPERRSPTTAARAATGSRTATTARTARTAARRALAGEAGAIDPNLAHPCGCSPPHEARYRLDSVKEGFVTADIESARRTDAAAQPISWKDPPVGPLPHRRSRPRSRPRRRRGGRRGGADRDRLREDAARLRRPRPGP